MKSKCNKNRPKDLSRAYIENEILKVKLEIIKKAENHIEVAFTQKNSAMVAAIAEILKSF